MRKDAKRAEKMRKEPSLMRKQALLYRNKVFFQEGIYKTEHELAVIMIYDAFDVKITLKVCEN